jgi:hypothetical protein
MLKKEARIITGGLSKPNKMPGPSINLPAVACITGAKLVKVKGSTCSGCYALKGRYRFKNVRDAMNRRLSKLMDPRWIDAMVTLINGRHWQKPEPVFRWHDSGDIQSVQHLKNIFEVCKRTPATAHWLPTRESRFLKLMDPDVVPKNLKIVLSDHMNNQQVPPSWWPYTSGVTTNHELVTCPASKQGNKCLDCRKCWDRNTKRVIYGKH